MRWIAAGVSLLLLIGASIINTRDFLGERHYAQTKIWTHKDPLQAFISVNEAYRMMPFDGRYRMQLIMSLEHLRTVKGHKVNLTPGAADKVSRIARTASPAHPAVLMSRSLYLLNTGRWKESDEIKTLIADMQRYAPRYPETWMMSAFYNARVGDQAKVATSLVQGMRVGGKLKDMNTFAQSIGMEISEK